MNNRGHDSYHESRDIEGQLQPGVHKRFGGWLWIFLIGCILVGISDLIVCILSPTPINLTMVPVLTFLRVRVAVSLLRISPVALRDVKIFLVSMFVASAFNLLRASVLPAAEFNSDDLQNLRAIGVRGLLSTVIWALYFQRSRRVRDTFGANL